MGRANETWNKKETTRRKEKKRKDKEKKREERSSNSTGPKSFDDMIAYVDESGNISSTPPDPDKKAVIKTEDIVIGVPKREELEPENPIRTGIVTFFNDSKGFGFIQDDVSRESVFFHVNETLEAVGKDNKVTYEIQSSHRGKNAVRVKMLK